MTATLWIGGSMHTAHMLREAGADAIHDGEITPERVKGRHCIIAPSGVKRDQDAAAERDARRALRLGAQSASIIPCRSLNGASDVADWLEQKNGQAVDLSVLANKAQPIQESSSEKTTAQPIEEHLVTDEANAKRAKENFSGELVYSPVGWLIWNSTRWHQDDDLALGQFSSLGKIVLQEAAALTQEAATESDPHRRKQLAATGEALTRYSQQSENLGKINAAMELTKPKLKKAIECFDADPLLLNCPNGIVDLRNGKLIAHDRNLYITKLAGCAYRAEAHCPTWERFLDDVFQGNKAIIAFIKRLVGYFLTASTREHILPIFYGLGANGKTTMLRIVMKILGEYARPAPAGFFELRRDSRDDQNTALLFGLRLVVGHETERGAMLRESFIKLVTGDDRLSGRRLYCEPFDFNPSHKLVLATNHRPRVGGTDLGIWRRLLLIPFEARFSKEAGNLDPMMREKLEAELEGVLAWAVEGCIAWLREGLNPPSEVRAATDAYRREEDVVAQFVDERCVLDQRSEEASGDVYRAYTAWAEAAGLRPLGQKGFVEQLKQLGIQPDKGIGGRRMLLNIRLREHG